VLFSFAGRKKNKDKNANTTEKTPSKEIPPLLKSGSSKQLKEPQIGKLDFMPPSGHPLHNNVQGVADRHRMTTTPINEFEDSIESL